MPQLLLIEGEHVTQDVGRKRKSGHRSHRSSRRSKKSEQTRFTKSGSPLVDGMTDKEQPASGTESQKGKVASSSKEGVSEDFMLRGSASDEESTQRNVLSSEAVKEEDELDVLAEGWWLNIILYFCVIFKCSKINLIKRLSLPRFIFL